MDNTYAVDYSILSRRVKEARKIKGYTQEQLAERMDVSWNFVAKIETNNTNISLATFVKLAKVLGVSADYLLSNDSDERVMDRLIADMLGDFENDDKELIISIMKSVRHYKGGR